jgi:hypothetical protein
VKFAAAVAAPVPLAAARSMSSMKSCTADEASASKMNALALDPQRLAAGYQAVDLRRFIEKTFGRGRGSRNHVFAAIEENQEAAAADEGEDTSNRVLKQGLKTER